MREICKYKFLRIKIAQVLDIIDHRKAPTGCKLNNILTSHLEGNIYSSFTQGDHQTKSVYLRSIGLLPQPSQLSLLLVGELPT